MNYKPKIKKLIEFAIIIFNLLELYLYLYILDISN